jgi:ribosomal protein L10
MALTLSEKQIVVSEVAEIASSALSAVASEYRGLTVDQMTALRVKARETGVYLRVVKNSLVKRAIEGTDFECMQDRLKGPLVMAFSQEDPGAAARLMRDFSKDNDQLVVKVLSVGGEVLEASDIGKLAIEDSILLKPSSLTKQERKEMEKHSLFGAKILDNPTSTIMKEARDISLYHHEKWDGSGYPHKLKGINIPLNARIVAVADVFDALVSKRCYKEAMGVSEALQIIIDGSGTHFDPKCVEAFTEAFDDLI